MKSTLLIVLTTCGALCTFAPSANAQQLHIVPAGNGLTAITDDSEGLTYYVRDPDAFIKKKYIMAKRVDGFGKRLSTSEFQKGTSVVEPVTRAVGDTAKAGARIPEVRRVLNPLRRLFGKPKYKYE